eukprot:2621196-Amphidinium_carterae.1
MMGWDCDKHHVAAKLAVKKALPQCCIAIMQQVCAVGPCKTPAHRVSQVWTQSSASKAKGRDGPRRVALIAPMPKSSKVHSCLRKSGKWLIGNVGWTRFCSIMGSSTLLIYHKTACDPPPRPLLIYLAFHLRPFVIYGCAAHVGVI